MATFKFTSPEGVTYKIDGPEGATEQEAFEILQEQLSQKDGGGITEKEPSGKAGSQKKAGQFLTDITTPRQPQPFSPLKILEAGGESAAVPATMAIGSAVIPGAQPAAVPLGLAAGGMFLSGAAGELSRQIGASPLTQFGAELVGGSGIEKTVTTGLYNAAVAAKNTLRGIQELNVKKLYEGFKGLGGVAEEQTAKRMAAQQAKIFGEKTAGYIPGETTGEFSAKAQEDLAKQYKFGEPVFYTPSGKFVETPVKPGTAVATGKEDLTKPVTGMAAKGEKVEKLEPYVRKPQIDPATGKMETVSATLRREMYDQVGKITVSSPAERFSLSPEFKQLQDKLALYVEQGRISRADKLYLENILKSDQKSVESQKVYGRTVDEQIRQWAGKPGAEGKGALDATISNSVRNDLRDSFAAWTKNRGLGSIEKDYRAAFTQEKIAEVKDNLPRIIAGYEGQAAMDKFVMQMKNDIPGAKQLFAKEMNTYFANIEAKNIPKEFKRLDKLAVRAELFRPEELQGIRAQVDGVMNGKIASEMGGKNIKRILSRALRRASFTEVVREVTGKD